MINKRIVMFGAGLGMTIGGFLPQLWGDDNFFSAAGILMSTIGGFAGIWLAIWLSKKFEL